MPLDSDIADADSHLHVEFYTNEIKDKIGQDGQPLTRNEGKPFVRIMNPGDKTSVFDQPAREHHMRRFARHWHDYKLGLQGDATLIGTPLEAWSTERPDELVRDQRVELEILGFRTVEQVAMASDHQMQKVGMGGVGVRSRAQTFLAARNMSTRDKELADTKKQLADMQAMLAQLVQNGSIQGDPPKNKGGRPRKHVDGDVVNAPSSDMAPYTGFEVIRVHNDDAATGPAGDERAGDTHS